MKYDKLLDIDETDKRIMELLQDDPEMTHSEIAEKVHKSQPAVGARIIKLRRKHLIAENVGVDFQQLNLKLARIDLATKDVTTLWERFNKCPYITNCFKLTGEYNMMIEILAPNLKSIDLFVDNCLRSDPLILELKVNYFIDSLRKYVVPLVFSIETYETQGCTYECGGKITKEDMVRLLSQESS